MVRAIDRTEKWVAKATRQGDRADDRQLLQGPAAGDPGGGVHALHGAGHLGHEPRILPRAGYDRRDGLISGGFVLRRGATFEQAVDNSLAETVS